MQPKALLLVEDNGDDEFLALLALKKTAIETITVARDGKEALDILLSKEHPLPDIVLLDLRLPKIDGLEVLAAIRREERTKELPIIILTSSEDPNDRNTCTSLGALSYLGKPIDMKEFQKTLDAIPEKQPVGRALPLAC